MQARIQFRVADQRVTAPDRGQTREKCWKTVVSVPAQAVGEPLLPPHTVQFLQHEPQRTQRFADERPRLCLARIESAEVDARELTRGGLQRGKTRALLVHCPFEFLHAPPAHPAPVRVREAARVLVEQVHECARANALALHEGVEVEHVVVLRARARTVEHTDPALEQAEAEVDVLGAVDLERLVESADGAHVFGAHADVARPEALEVVRLAVLHVRVAEYEVRDLEVPHERVVQGREGLLERAEHGDVASGRRTRVMRGEVLRDEIRERDRIVVDEQEVLAARGSDARVARRGEPAVRAVQYAPSDREVQRVEPGARVVRRTVVHDDQLEVRRGAALPEEARQAAFQDRATVVRAQDDREPRRTGPGFHDAWSPRGLNRTVRIRARRGGTPDGDDHAALRRVSGALAELRVQGGGLGRHGARAPRTVETRFGEIEIDRGAGPLREALEARARQALIVVQEAPLAALRVLLQDVPVHRGPHAERSLGGHGEILQVGLGATLLHDALRGHGRVSEDAQIERVPDMRAPRGQRVAEARVLEAPWFLCDEALHARVQVGRARESGFEREFAQPALSGRETRMARQRRGEQRFVDAIDGGGLEEPLRIRGPRRVGHAAEFVARGRQGAGQHARAATARAQDDHVAHGSTRWRASFDASR